MEVIFHHFVFFFSPLPLHSTHTEILSLIIWQYIDIYDLCIFFKNVDTSKQINSHIGPNNHCLLTMVKAVVTWLMNLSVVPTAIYCRYTMSKCLIQTHFNTLYCPFNKATCSFPLFYIKKKKKIFYSGDSLNYLTHISASLCCNFLSFTGRRVPIHIDLWQNKNGSIMSTMPMYTVHWYLYR